MKRTVAYILVGEQGVKDFRNEDWESLEENILDNYDAEIVAWDKNAESVSELLEMLRGWDDFIELFQEDIKNIENNTKVVIL